MDKNMLTSNGISHRGFLFKFSDFNEYSGPCPVCGYDGDREIISAIAGKHNIYFLKCQNCIAVSSSHYITPSVLREYYSQFFRLSGFETLNISMDNYKLYSKFLSCIFNFAINSKYVGLKRERERTVRKDSIQILDYGGGSGLISYNIAKNLIECGKCKQVDAVIVDYSNNMMNFNGSKDIKIHHMEPDSKNWREMKFDVVMANDVIEHIFHVKPVIDSLLGCVGRNGFLLFKTAYIQPLYNFLLRLGWKNLPLTLYPEHIHDFSAEFFSHFFKTFNQDEYEVIISSPSFFSRKVFGREFKAAIAARVIRAPYYIFKNYPFVGGWQFIAQRTAD